MTNQTTTTELQKLANIFPTLTKEQAAQINQLISGKRRFTEFSGLMKNFGKVNEIVAGVVAAARI